MNIKYAIALHKYELVLEKGKTTRAIIAVNTSSLLNQCSNSRVWKKKKKKTHKTNTNPTKPCPFSTFQNSDIYIFF